MALFIALLLFEYFSAQRGSGVAYNGKSLEYWLSETPSTASLGKGVYARASTFMIDGQTYGAADEPVDDVEQAFRAMGTNCLPLLLKKLNLHETKFSSVIDWLKVRLKMKTSLLGRNWERGQAVTALIYLDHLPDNVYEQIRGLSKNGNPGVAASAQIVLDQCHKMSDAHPTVK